MNIAAEIEKQYEYLKLLDRIRPGRTPWQTLRKQATADVLEKLPPLRSV